MKPNALKSKLALIFVLALLLGGCTYYNTFYNARRSFKDGEKAQKRATAQNRHSVGKNHYENAIKKASKVLTFHPKSKWADDALFLIGRAYFNMGEYVKARRKFEELQASFAKSKLVDESHYYISMCHYFSGEEIGAINSLKSLLESERIKSKRKAQASFTIGEIYFERKEFADALIYYDKTLSEFEPDTLSPITRFRIGECMWQEKDYQKAREAFAQVEKLDPSLDLLFESKFKEGECLYILGDHLKGMEIYLELSEDERFSTRLASVRLQIAQGYYFSEELSLAMEENLQVTEGYARTEESAKAYFRLGEIYQEVFVDLQRAKEMFESCSNEASRSEIAKEALTRNANISRIAEYQEALSDEESEQSGKSLFLLGELYLTQMDQPDSALAQYLALANRFPESEYAAKSLYAAAWIKENIIQDPTGAEEIYWRILSEYPESDYLKPALGFLEESPESFGIEADNAERIYREAERLLLVEHEVDSALALYERIIEEFPHSLYAGKSAYAKAWTIEYYANPGDSSAIFAYQTVIDEYPESEYAEEAKIKLGLAARAQPTLPAPRETTPTQEEEDSTLMAQPDTSGPQIPKAPLPVQRGQFVYPETEIMSGIRGGVVLKIRIEFDGTVSEAEVVNSLDNPWIDEAAQEAALNTVFDVEKIDMKDLGGWFLYTVEVKPPGDQDPHTDQTLPGQQQQ
ncbi:MAG: TonB family protein [Candidatus Zixiibacteriota bacterium]|nr:MAG: TonB family protein [candidate division Zixibacteria bacterium]